MDEIGSGFGVEFGGVSGFRGGGLISDNRLSAARSGPLIYSRHPPLEMLFCKNRVVIVPNTKAIDASLSFFFAAAK